MANGYVAGRARAQERERERERQTDRQTVLVNEEEEDVNITDEFFVDNALMKLFVLLNLYY